MTRYWISTPITTVIVTVDDNSVVLGQAEMKKEFIGRHLDELLESLKRQGQVEMMEI